MEHAVDALEQRLQGRLRDVALDEPEGAVAGALLEVALLAGPRVVVGEGVDADDRAAANVERLDQMRADEARAARDEVRAAGPQIVAALSRNVATAEAARQLGCKRGEGVVTTRRTRRCAPRHRRRGAPTARPPRSRSAAPVRRGRRSAGAGHCPTNLVDDDRQVASERCDGTVADVRRGSSQRGRKGARQWRPTLLGLGTSSARPATVVLVVDGPEGRRATSGPSRK